MTVDDTTRMKHITTAFTATASHWRAGLVLRSFKSLSFRMFWHINPAAREAAQTNSYGVYIPVGFQFFNKVAVELASWHIARGGKSVTVPVWGAIKIRHQFQLNSAPDPHNQRHYSAVYTENYPKKRIRN